MGITATRLPSWLSYGWTPFVPTCRHTESPGWEVLVSRGSVDGYAEDEMRELLVCDASKKTGTPWPLDGPTPWKRAGMTREDWLAVQPALTDPVQLPKP